MTVDVRALALLVDRVAAEIPGVTRVFPASPSAARVARQTLGSSGPLSIVRATGGDAVSAAPAAGVTTGTPGVGVGVEVCVGVEGDPSSVGDEVSRAVRAALAEAVLADLVDDVAVAIETDAVNDRSAAAESDLVDDVAAVIETDAVNDPYAAVTEIDLVDDPSTATGIDTALAEYPSAAKAEDPLAGTGAQAQPPAETLAEDPSAAVRTLVPVVVRVRISRVR